MSELLASWGGGRTGVGHADLVDLIGVEPDLALAALEHRLGEPLLEKQTDTHVDESRDDKHEESYACRPLL